MTIIKWEPFKNMAMLQDRINRLFEDAFPQSDSEDEGLAECSWKPLVDIHDSPEGVVVRMDLPGVTKEDVSVEVKNNQLIIEGVRQAPADADNVQYFRRERVCGTFRRTFALRSRVSPDSIKASFKNGVLTIIVPEPEEEKPKKISVSID
jgi:HSP20 family protein